MAAILVGVSEVVRPLATISASLVVCRSAQTISLRQIGLPVSKASTGWLSGDARTAHFGTFDLTRDRKALGSVTGRLGYTRGPSLLYVKGGYAYQDTSFGVASIGVPTSVALSGNKKNGYTVGGGLEYLFTPNWSGKIEYQYYNFGKGRFVGVSPGGLVTAGSFDNNVHAVKVGLNYRFN